MSNFLDLEGLRSYHAKLVSLIKSLAEGVSSFKGRTGAVVPQDGDYNAFMVGAVPDTRTVNGKQLNADITLTKDDIEGLDTITPDLSGYVPTSRKVNNKALTSDITLSASDVSAVPASRTVNGKALSSNISLSASDVSALPITGGTLTGDLRIKGSGNSGTKINLGDSDYVHIAEPESLDDCLEIKAKKVNFVLSDTTDAKFTVNGESPFGSSGSGVGQSMAGQSVKPTSDTTVTAGEGAEIFNDYRDRTYDDSQTMGTEGNVASGRYAHAEGSGTTASGTDTHAEGYGTVASGAESHAEGFRTVATWVGSHAEGIDTKAHANGAHAEGQGTSATEQYSHAEGNETKATGKNSHAEGYSTTASGLQSHAGGYGSTATGSNSFAFGIFASTDAACQFAIGPYNVKSSSESDRFIIGGGFAMDSRSNCFRVTDTGTFASGSYNSSGADYAELFEWLDGNVNNEDRIGLFVTLDGEYIRLANSTDNFILGIVSGNPSVIGDVYDDQWQGMYLYDIYGRPIWEDVEVPDEVTEEPDPGDPSKTITQVLIPAHIEHRRKLNPNYDNTQTYIPRTQRKEWACVGMMGKLVVRDDGSCEVNGYVKVGEDGKATRSETETKYRVISRIDEAHVRLLILANS